MSEDKNTKINEEVVLSESEKQERLLREQFKIKKRNRRIRKLIIWAVVILVLALGLSWYMQLRENMRAEQEAMMARSSQVQAKVTRNVYTATIDLSGYVEAYDIQNARFRATGPITAVNVEEGDVVHEGDVLATIDSTSQTYNVESIRRSIREAELSGTQSQLELLNLQLTTALNNLEYTNLVANFDGTVAGTVADVNITEGDYFEAGSTDAAVTIADLSRLKATVEIDEIDMQYVYLGQTAYLTFDSIPGQVVEAYVSYIPTLGTYSSQGIGVVEVELTIDNPPASLKPGYSFEGTIASEGDVEMLLIPQAAVTTGRGGATTVQKLLEDGTTETVSVSVKYLGEGTCQLVAGNLSEGDTLVYTRETGGFMGMMRF